MNGYRKKGIKSEYLRFMMYKYYSIQNRGMEIVLTEEYLKTFRLSFDYYKHTCKL